MEIHPIGTIRTQYTEAKGTPIQPAFAETSLLAVAELDETYSAGLEGLEKFSHAILIFWFHQSQTPKLKQKPFLGDREYGVFAIRSPHRPNPIGISVVEIVKIEDHRLYFNHADMLDETPLLDIKPFVPEFDNRPHAGKGWLEGKLEKISKNL
ncbi:MAG: tRNA (N6-threonylcarbamoyladenosine(37)-N6)-methyltransferase TrmO [Bacteroidales bacterium]|jgi:tRNA-Thr(GGU) m(6)t(6)A37 methyltransferase TsaA|nr:tRNA (N6-threonylcarbamoyladenosine(37)-N6)-methyltransferase TrmO [Bacteroidales bacterium]MDN5350230.1 tRNA (adenine37-N6)-methyltransferase [Bacteroidales bacterium]